MIRRHAARLLKRRLADFPAVALLGPRQSGKTTLAKSLSAFYFDLEQEADRLRLDLRWNALMDVRRPIILDEAQAWPDVFPRLRGAIDRAPARKGRFLLLGSVSPALMKNVSESLAGRLATCELTPFFLPEMGADRIDALWLRGGYPDGGVLHPRRFPLWQREYLSVLAQKDLPDWGLPAKPQMTQRLFKMLAVGHGQTWNASQAGQSLGLSYHTASTYLDYLVDAYLIHLLPAYHANLRKRLVKAPKMYWRDSGLLHALMNVDSMEALLSQPWVGASWEGFAIEQIRAHLSAQGRPFEAYFMRTNDGHEIDLVLEYAGKLWAVEIKLSASPGSDDLRRLNRAADIIGADRRVLVSRTPTAEESGRSFSGNLEKALQWIGGR